MISGLRKAKLYESDLSGADLRKADLRGAKLYGANLNKADLRGADLYGSNLSGADLYGSDLSGADLRKADLYGSDLCETELRKVNFHRALNYYSFFAYDTSKRIVHCVKHEKTWMIKAGVLLGNFRRIGKESKRKSQFKSVFSQH